MALLGGSRVLLAKKLFLLACLLVGRRTLPVWGMAQQQQSVMVSLLAARSQEEREHLRSVRETLPAYVKEVFNAVTSQPGSGDLVALPCHSTDAYRRRLSFNISLLPRDHLMDHAELVIPKLRHPHRCLPHVRTWPEHDAITPVREVSEDGWDVVLDASAPLQLRERRRSPLLTFHVQPRSQGHHCHASTSRDLDLSHAYLVTLDSAAHRLLLAHRTARLGSSARSGRRLEGVRRIETRRRSSGDDDDGLPGGRRHYHGEGGEAGEAHRHRARRQVMPPSSLLHSDLPDCHLVPWSVSVEDAGLDKVIYPPEVPVNRCYGVCRPPNYSHAFVNHTVLKGLYAESHSTPHLTCSCVPVSFSSVSVVYETPEVPGNFRRFNIETLKATACGCR